MIILEIGPACEGVHFHNKNWFLGKWAHRQHAFFKFMREVPGSAHPQFSIFAGACGLHTNSLAGEKQVRGAAGLALNLERGLGGHLHPFC